MSTYNGEKYLSEQIDSILAQEGVHVELFVRDDGSSDSTKDILRQYASNHGNIHVDFGKNVGAGWSFINELIAVPEFEYYAFSDQDDYWKPEKLIAAVKLLKQKETETSSSTPILYYSNVILTDEKLNALRITKREKRMQSYECATVKRVLQGCTMLMNAKLRELVKKYPITDVMLSRYHDTFFVSLVHAVGGRVVCDPEAHMLYRSHSNNTTDAPAGIIARILTEIKEIRRFSGNEAKITQDFLRIWGNDMSPETRAIFALIAGYRKNLASRLRLAFSPKFRTGDIRLTLLGKFKALMGWL